MSKLQKEYAPGAGLKCMGFNQMELQQFGLRHRRGAGSVENAVHNAHLQIT